jgi:uncharacterized protein (DUF2237 family)
VEKDWPLHDPEGFTRVQTSMVDFGHHVFCMSIAHEFCEKELIAFDILQRRQSGKRA